jgi:uncharacterized repeat protein (TIGR01451 family)
MTRAVCKKSRLLVSVLVLSLAAVGRLEASGSWSSTGGMTTARSSHTATLLLDGRVLVTGGENLTDGALATAEIYDPQQGTWSSAGTMATSRRDHTATWLPNGKVLVSGGYTYVQGSPGFTPLQSAELYDPVFNSWSSAAPMSSPRFGHTATLLPNGNVLVIGGNDGLHHLATAEIYDSAQGTWSTIASMSEARGNHTATLTNDDRILVAGGWDSSTNLGSATAERFDQNLGWLPAGSMSVARISHTATLLPDGTVLVAGGHIGGGAGSYLDSADVYDPGSGTWSPTASMSTARSLAAATRLPAGALITGGYFPPQGGYLSGVEIYVQSLGAWAQTGSMSVPRALHTATLLADGTVLVVGGISGQGYLASAERYTPPGDQTPPQVSCKAADGDWHATDVTILCTASDSESGLADPNADASFTLTTNVATGFETADAATNSRSVCNTDNVCTKAGPITGNKVDKKAPVILCGSPDNLWHSADVVIACSASDAGSGLANVADASFNLTTSVPAGTETASAGTNTRSICDALNQCSAAGPIVGNKVDKKGPTVTVTSPAANATYQLNAVVAASYTCADGGSGVASCQGTVANGSAIDTSSTGTKTFTVNTSDNVGNTSSPFVTTYTVVTGGGGGQGSADLGLTLSAPAKVAPGSTLTYSITVTNGSRTAASGAVVSDALPTGTVFASASTSQGTVTAPTVGSNGTVNVNIGNIAGNGTVSISVVVTVTATSGATLTDTAKVTATTQDLNQNNNSATKSTKVSK